MPFTLDNVARIMGCTRDEARFRTKRLPWIEQTTTRKVGLGTLIVQLINCQSDDEFNTALDALNQLELRVRNGDTVHSLRNPNVFHQWWAKNKPADPLDDSLVEASPIEGEFA
mgnify:FL=1